MIAGPHGVKELTLDGAEVRSLSQTPGRSPRWLPGHEAIVFLGTRGGRSRDLRRIEVATGDERRLARLPLALPCPRAAYEVDDDDDWGGVPELDVTNEDELYIADDGKHVCLVLADHEADLRTLQRALSVKSHGGRLRTAWLISDDTCDAPEEPALAECERSYDVDDDDEDQDALPFAGYVESRSPDGKWALVRVASTLGDVVHAQYVLYADARGKAYPLSLEARARWPKPVTPPPEADDYDLVEGLPEIAGSPAMHWVGPRHLIARRTLFIAGKRAIVLDGDAAY